VAYSARILADSQAPTKARLTTFEITFPRFVHSELMTHREFSRNAASSRAIPIEKMIQRVKEDPAMPVFWGKNQKGMQAVEALHKADQYLAEIYWLRGRDQAVSVAEGLVRVGAHKQIVNRVLEPWMWITVIVSATNFSNFFSLRCHPDAQPEIRRIAEMMRDLYFSATPKMLAYGDWHMPLLDDRAELLQAGATVDTLVKISVGRCARVSYLTHDGKRDPQADVDLHDRLLTSGHWSPFEHVAQAALMHQRFGTVSLIRSGNFEGFYQYRKLFNQEYVKDYSCQ
jgi:thymidylate synthase ThyX